MRHERPKQAQVPVITEWATYVRQFVALAVVLAISSPIQMSTKHIRTAADLVRFGASLKIDCGGCGAARTMTGTEVVKALGRRGLHGAEQRLTCSRCGARQAWLTIVPPL
jgi:hypothetical protein